MPSTIAGRFTLVVSLVSFLTENPDYEVPSLLVTAAEGTALQEATSTARQALLAAAVTFQARSGERTTTFNLLTTQLRAVIKNLNQKLTKDDPRWFSFGLKLPATKTTPGQVTNLTATVDENGIIMVRCDAEPLAERYRTRMLLVGVDTDYGLAASTVEPLAAIKGVEPGRTAQIIVQAVNGGSQGVASEPIWITVPLLATEKTALPEPMHAVIEEPIASTNGNGSHENHGALTAAAIAAGFRT